MKKKDTRKNIIYGIILILVVITVIIIINIANGNNSKEEKKETNQIETNQVEELPQDSDQMQDPDVVENAITQ